MNAWNDTHIHTHTQTQTESLYYATKLLQFAQIVGAGVKQYYIYGQNFGSG